MSKKLLPPTNKFPNGTDPETGLRIKADGTLHAHAGHGANRKYIAIPPADMSELVQNGLAPELVPNWDPDDPNSNWQCGYRKFTPERRQIFLTKLEQTGRVRLAARFAGVSHTTIFRHREADPQFDAACEDAEAMYHETVVASITHQARVGMIDERYDKEGQLVARRVTYEQQIRKTMLQRADERYRDHTKQDVSVVGGAVVVPAPTESVETWEDVVKRYTGGGGFGNAPQLPSEGANLPITTPELTSGNVVEAEPDSDIGSQVPDMSDD